MAFLALVFLVVFIIGVVVLIKGGSDKLRIPNRKTAAIVTVVSFILFVGFAGASTDGEESADTEEVVADPNNEANNNDEDNDENNNENNNGNDSENNNGNNENDEVVDGFVVEYDQDVSFDNDSITISGTTNFEDGTLITYDISHMDEYDYWIEENIEVMDGSFEETIDISDYPGGEIIVWVAFVPYLQDESLQEVYGGMGENLTGDVIYNEELEANEIVFEETYTKEGASVRFGSGTHVVGEDIEPGIYKTDDTGLYWERLSGFSNEFDDIITNGNTLGQTYVEIKESDEGFGFSGPGEFYLVDLDEHEGDLLTEFSDGMYIVGQDIESGQYRSDGNGGYFARLNALGGDLDDIITNGNADGEVVVDIQEGDLAFETSGGQVWTKIN